MSQKNVVNNDYEILTPNGWESFDAVIFNQGVNKSGKIITLSNGYTITATDDHKFISNDNEIAVINLQVGNYLDTDNGTEKIISIISCILPDTYDIFNTVSHIIYANSIKSHQCDEFSFVRPRVAEDFWTAISPTLATGGKCIITSTPNSDEDKFAEIWAGANKTIDEYGDEIPGGFGVNGFKAFTCHYSEVPGRDEKWAQVERNKIGADKFSREYGCEFLTADSTLINAVTLLKLQGTDPIFKTNEIRWYDNIYPNKTYLIALDPSAGVGKDFAAIEVYVLPDMKQIAEWTHNRTSIPNQVKTMQNIVNFIASEML